MKISRVIIRNWRSVKEADFEPADMTVLIGANNAGKTNILSAINFLIGTSNYRRIVRRVGRKVGLSALGPS